MFTFAGIDYRKAGLRAIVMVTKMRKSKVRKSGGRGRGRPKGFNRPQVPWLDVDQRLVYGEVWQDEESGEETHRYPSYKDLAERYGCSKTLIGHYSHTHNCMSRRKEAKQTGERKPAMRTTEPSAADAAGFDGKRGQNRVLMSRGRPISPQDSINIVDACLREFARALEEGRFRCDSPADLKLLLQLREKLDEERTQSSVEPEITLAQIQARHRELREEMPDYDPWKTGKVREDGND